MDISREKLQQIIEGALLAYGQPMSVNKIQTLFVENDEETDPPSKEDIQAALEDIQAECKNKGYELKEISTGYRFQVKQELAPWVNLLWEEKPQKYSRALLETLALIAYRQPITRGDIEEIRGVAVSSTIIRTLIEREWVRIVGHRDVPGRPALYATTKAFLDYFNLKNLEDLPPLGDIKELEDLNQELEFNEDQPATEQQGDIAIATDAASSTVELSDSTENAGAESDSTQNDREESDTENSDDTANDSVESADAIDDLHHQLETEEPSSDTVEDEPAVMVDSANEEDQARMSFADIVQHQFSGSDEEVLTELAESVEAEEPAVQSDP